MQWVLIGSKHDMIKIHIHIALSQGCECVTCEMAMSRRVVSVRISGVVVRSNVMGDG